MDWLNEYMEVMSPIVGGHGGVILRFIGDAIMAVFGVPVASTTEAQIRQNAVNAVTCALAMQRKLIEHNRSLNERGLPMIGMRIGILTGPMVAGSMGSAQRLEYNVHGDTVNTAARQRAGHPNLPRAWPQRRRARRGTGRGTNDGQHSGTRLARRQQYPTLTSRGQHSKKRVASPFMVLGSWPFS
jgi:hypothetical protein